MSKKLYSLPRYKRLQERRARRQRLRLAKKQAKKGGPPTSPSIRQLRKKQRRPYARLVVPECFSLRENPDDVIWLLDQLSIVSRARNIDLDMTEVQDVGSCAVAALLALIKRHNKHTSFRGTFPRNSKAKELLYDTGFREHVKTGITLGRPPNGRIEVLENLKVEPTLARRLIHHASQALTGRPSDNFAVYRALMECMGNTRHHAARGSEQSEYWWATAHPDLKRMRASFTFLDLGQGIFTSIGKRASGIRKFYNNDGGDIDLMEDLLKGEVGSRTNLPYRGKGIPALYELARAQKIENLVIISESVYASVSDEQYRALGRRFPGTLLYWEVNYEDSRKN